MSEAARLNLITAVWQVRSHARLSVLENAATEQRVALLKAQVALREDLAGRLELQFQAGAISALERNVARLALLRTRADLADAERLLAEAQPHLASALGLPVTGLENTRIQFDLTAAPKIEDLSSNAAREWALRGRADVLTALADYAASQSLLQLEIARQYPDIRLAPGYSWNAGSTGEHDWQLGVTVELPVLNQHHGAIAEASARREATAARFRALQTQVINEVDTAVASFRANLANLNAVNSLVASQSAQRALVQQELQAGAVDRLDLLTADLELNAAAVTQLDAFVRLQQAVGALEDAVQRPTPLPASLFEIRQAAANK